LQPDQILITESAMMLLRNRVVPAALTLALLGAAQPACADRLSEGWSLRAQVYGWFPAIEGATVFEAPADGTTASIDAGDYLNALRFAFMGSIEARRGRFGALADVIYLNFDADRSGSRDLTLSGPLGLIEIPAGVAVDVDVSLSGWTGLVAGTYAIDPHPRADTQLLGGVRYLSAELKLAWDAEAEVGALPPALRAGADRVQRDVWDGVVGAKGRLRLGDSAWFAPYYVDLGAGQSDFTWQAMVDVGYRFSWGEVMAAYRHLEYRFSGDAGIKDLAFGGPGLAVAFSW
jgi:hypothetical protein